MNSGRFVILGGLIAFIVITFVLTTNNHTTVEQIRTEMAGTIEQENLEQKGPAELKKRYGIISGETEEYFIYSDEKESELGEVLVIKAPDRDKLDQFRKAAEKHLQAQRITYAQGNDVQKRQLENAIIKERGHFLLVAIGDHVDEIEKVFTKSVR